MSCSVRLTGSTQKQERLKVFLSQAGVSKEGNGWGTGGELLEVPDSCQKKKKKLSKLWMTSELILGYREFLLPGHQFIFQTGLAVARTHYCSTAYMQLSVKPALISALVGHHCRWVQNWRQWIILPPQGSALRCSIRRSKKGALLSLMVCPERGLRICSMITPESFSNTVQSELHENEGASAASAPGTCLVPATVICWNKDTPQAVKCILAKCWDNNTSLQLGSSVHPFWENHKVLLRFHEKIKKLKKTTLGRKKSFLVLNWS